ncbi:MAG: hypothetical protein WDO73_32295 [Ignavibacteriota bacterium]
MDGSLERMQSMAGENRLTSVQTDAGEIGLRPIPTLMSHLTGQADYRRTPKRKSAHELARQCAQLTGRRQKEGEEFFFLIEIV